MTADVNQANAAPGINFDVAHVNSDVAKKRLRDRYIDVRFPQIAETNTSLNNTSAVLRCARQFLDDERPALAVELLELALEEDPSQRAAWLFLIEYAFLESDAPRLAELAAAYAARFGRDDASVVIDAMGHELMPQHPQFRHVTQTAALPNWSSLAAAGRDDGKQKLYHAALLRAVAFHLGR